MGLITNNDFEVIGEVKQTSGGLEGIMYEDFRNVNGILIPFTEKHTDGKTNMTIIISKIEINKAGNADFTPSCKRVDHTFMQQYFIVLYILIKF